MKVDNVASQMTLQNNNVRKQKGSWKGFFKASCDPAANQDPLSPMEDTDFIAQMAQFSALEEMSIEQIV